MIHTGVIQIQPQAENGNEEVFGDKRPCVVLGIRRTCQVSLNRCIQDNALTEELLARVPRGSSAAREVIRSQGLSSE
jgi:hypothetical protein